MNIKIAASILSADRDNLQKDVNEIENYSDWLHIDIMDGKFVPPVTFIPNQIKSLETKLIKDVHLMVNYPLKENFIRDYIDAGADIITIHEECMDNINKCMDYIKNNGVKLGISINPPTLLKNLMPYLNRADMILIMSVNPGYGGQKFMPEVLQKIKEIRKLNSVIDIQIDGGINKDTIKYAVNAGANVLVAGSAIFGKEDRKKAIEELRYACKN